MNKLVLLLSLSALLSSAASCDQATPRAAAEPSPAAPVTGPLPANKPGPSQSSGAGTPGSIVMTFDADEVGAPAKGTEAVIGDWVVAERAGARGLLVDGSRFRSGTPSVSLADQARRLYGERYAEFLDGVRAFAFFPLTVLDQLPPSGNVKMSVRFYPFGGQVDQAAGVAFGIQPDGSYLCVPD